MAEEDDPPLPLKLFGPPVYICGLERTPAGVVSFEALDAVDWPLEIGGRRFCKLWFRLNSLRSS